MKCLTVGAKWVISNQKLELSPPESKYLKIKNISISFFNPDAMGIYGL